MTFRLSRPGMLLVATGLVLAAPALLLLGGRPGPPPSVALGSSDREGPVAGHHLRLVPPASAAPTTVAPPRPGSPAPTRPTAPAPTAPSGNAGSAQAAALPAFSHVFTIVMENEESTSIIGSPAAPYINGLAGRYGLATNYYGASHPSLPNYLALTAGSTFGIASDCTTCYVTAVNIADQVEASGRSWRAYMEDMPAPCFAGAWSGAYAMKHDPFMYYNDIRTDAARCAAHVVPFTRFWTDLRTGQVPNYVFITPNMCNDMHDCPVSTGDAWLRSVVPAITGSPAFRNGGVLFITWDEGASGAGCCGDAWGGRVATLVISPMAIPGYRSGVAENHYSLLRTIEDAWHLSHLGAAGNPGTSAMREYFRS
ncbi:MAG: hypothetical protein M3077_09660 [Candidatus Dormibacteraeota bacterium]|nr:hypothetical protein [Candidatus Dormibacteraeota bacterium]